MSSVVNAFQDSQAHKKTIDARQPILSCQLRAGDDAEDFFFAHDDEIFTIQLDFGAGVFAEQNVVAFFNREREYLAFVVALAASDGDDFALLWFIFGADQG